MRVQLHHQHTPLHRRRTLSLCALFCCCFASRTHIGVHTTRCVALSLCSIHPTTADHSLDRWVSWLPLWCTPPHECCSALLSHSHILAHYSVVGLYTEAAIAGGNTRRRSRARKELDDVRSGEEFSHTPSSSYHPSTHPHTPVIVAAAHDRFVCLFMCVCVCLYSAIHLALALRPRHTHTHTVTSFSAAAVATISIATMPMQWWRHTTHRAMFSGVFVCAFFSVHSCKMQHHTEGGGTFVWEKVNWKMQLSHTRF